jgi:Ca2+-transporting ATPase
MAPDHKLRLVAAFQARGDTVAVIGDGVNDAPALRKSDIGIAMGLAGTDVAKQAASVILTDDNFGAIAVAVEEGRAVFDNLRKFTTYIFASNIPEIMPFIFMALFHWPLALTVTQILAIDLGTDLLPALALSTERPEPNVMRRTPRRRSAQLVDNRLLARAVWLGAIETVLCYLGFFAVFAMFGYADFGSLPRSDLIPFSQRLLTQEGLVYVMATTVFHLGVVAGQIGSAFVTRTETDKVHHLGFFSNRFLLLGVAVEVGLIWLLIYFRPLADAFEHRPPPAEFWGILIIYPAVVYILDWLRKLFVRSRIEAQYTPGTRHTNSA